MKELWSPGAGVVKQLPPLHHESARLSVSRPESGGPRDRNAGLRRLRNPASEIGGAEGSRTPDPKTASLVLSQLSYSPTRENTLQARAEGCQGMVPAVGLEPTSPYGHPVLSRNRLPISTRRLRTRPFGHTITGRPGRRAAGVARNVRNGVAMWRFRMRHMTSCV